MARNWFPEERRKQADAVRKWTPWQQSTGPRTEEGKDISKENAFRHGLRSAEGIEFTRLLAAQKLFVRSAMMKALLKK